MPHDCTRELQKSAPPDSWLGLAFRASRFPTDQHDAADTLRAIAELRKLLEEAENQAALQARRSGATWQEIADELGLTRQRVHQRWGNIARFAEWGPTEDN